MTKRKVYVFTYFVLLLICYLMVALLIPDISPLQYISLLFTTISSALLYFVPVLLPKKEKGYMWMRIRLFFICISYFIISLAVCYLYSFEFTMHAHFYFVVHSLSLLVVILLLFVSSFTPKVKVEEEPPLE